MQPQNKILIVHVHVSYKLVKYSFNGTLFHTNIGHIFSMHHFMIFIYFILNDNDNDHDTLTMTNKSTFEKLCCQMTQRS